MSLLPLLYVDLRGPAKKQEYSQKFVAESSMKSRLQYASERQQLRSNVMPRKYSEKRVEWNVFTSQFALRESRSP